MATFDTYGTYAAGSTSWVAPFGISAIQVQVWGGGGGGGGTGALLPGAGGGGGAYAIGSSVSGTAGSSYAIVVGAGGTASATGNGGKGVSSYFGGSVVLAEGGVGGTANSAGGGKGGTLVTGNLTFVGGNGANGTIGTSGGGGGGAGSTSAGSNASIGTGGAGGGGGGGGGGAQHVIGTAPGGGGGGRLSTTTAKAGGAGKMILGYNVTPGTLDQKHYRFFNDTVNLNGAGTFANEDAAITGTMGNNYRFRAEIANTGGTAGTTSRLFQWQGAGHAWQNMTNAVGDDLYLSDSSYFADAAAVTQRLTGVGTFIAGQGKDTGSVTAAGTVTGNNNIEDEWNFKLGTASVVGSVYNLRVTNNGTAYAAYSVTGTITAGTIPKAETLTDNFDDNTVNTVVWDNFATGGASVAEAGSQLQCVPGGAADGNSGYLTKGVYDLTDSYVTTQLVQPASVSSCLSVLQVKAAENYVFIGVNNSNQLAVQSQAGPITTTAYSSATMKYLKISESAGTVSFYYSGDGASWTYFSQTANPFDAHYVFLSVNVYEAGADASAGTAIFDNFNIAGTAAPTPKISTLTDTFSAGTVDLGKWNVWGTNSGTAYVSSGMLVEQVAATTNQSWSGVYSVGTYDLTGTEIFVQAPIVGSGNTFFDLTLSTEPLPSNNFFSIGVSGGTELQAFLEIAAGSTMLGTVVYNSTNHAWWKIKEDTGTVSFAYSADCVSWGTLYAGTFGLAKTALYVVLDNYEFNDASSPGTSAFDNLNTAPATPGTSTFIGYKTLLGVGA